MDRQIIKAYDSKGNIHKICRIYTDDKLNITFKVYPTEVFEIESWENTILRKRERLSKLETHSIEVIKTILAKYPSHIPTVLTSSGKDSQVVSHLLKGISKNSYFNNTSLDCADTYRFVKSLDNLKILNPKQGFYQWRKEINFIPTRFARSCCRIFKEEATLTQLDINEKLLFFMGMRNDESAGRSDYQDEWINDKWGKADWIGCLPIREWTEEDIWLYTLQNNIAINPKYKKGYSRVGCAIACPYYTKSTWVLDKHWYPIQYNRWQRILKEDFISNNKWTIMNCTQDEYMTCWNGGVFRPKPTIEVIEEFATNKNIDFEIAAKYFNHECSKDGCTKKVNKNNDIAMNLKCLGRNTNKFYCKKHLMEFLDIDKKEWDQQIKLFKKQGCDLF